MHHLTKDVASSYKLTPSLRFDHVVVESSLYNQPHTLRKFYLDTKQQDTASMLTYIVLGLLLHVLGSSLIARFGVPAWFNVHMVLFNLSALILELGFVWDTVIHFLLGYVVIAMLCLFVWHLFYGATLAGDVVLLGFSLWLLDWYFGFGLPLVDQLLVTSFGTYYTLPLHAQRLLDTPGRPYRAKRPTALVLASLALPFFIEILVGLMLGDGSMSVKAPGAYFSIKQVVPYADFVLWLREHLYDLGFVTHASLGPQLPPTSYGVQPYYLINSYCVPELIALYNLWYCKSPSGKSTKILPSFEYLMQYLTPLALAIWFMGDGSAHHGGGLCIASQSFTLAENELLAAVLRAKYGLKVSIHTADTRPQLFIWKESAPEFYRLVKPYIAPSFAYKFSKVKLD